MRLKELRQKNKLTQADLAKKLYLTPQAISKWERNKSYPDLPTIIALSKLYNVSTDELLGVAKQSFITQLFSNKRGRFNMLKKVTELTYPHIFCFSLTHEFNWKDYPELQKMGIWQQLDEKTCQLIINQKSLTNDLTEVSDLFKVITNKKEADFSIERTYQVFGF